MSDDEKAFMLLEKAVNKAQASLEKTKHFQPFLMLLNDAGETEVFENPKVKRLVNLMRY